MLPRKALMVTWVSSMDPAHGELVGSIRNPEVSIFFNVKRETSGSGANAALSPPFCLQEG